VRVPRPQALLVEHPALPVPVPLDGGLAPTPAGQVMAERVAHRERARLALQLTALCSLLAEFDLWLAPATLRRARVMRTTAGPMVAIPGFPRPLSPVIARLGRGAGAADRTRDASLAAIAAAVGLSRDELEVEPEGPGFYLEPALSNHLGRLPLPLDLATARCLWAVRWDLPPLPEAGDMAFWQVPDDATACRLGAAIWCALVQGDRRARFVVSSADATLALRSLSADPGDALVVAGTLEPEQLAAVERTVSRHGCAAVVIGGFPPGWDPPRPPVFDPDRLHRHLAVTGVPLDRCHHEVERRRGRFHPFHAADRAALTGAASELFRERREATCRSSGHARVARLLGLLPDGVPEGFLVDHSGLEPVTLGRVTAELQAVERDGRWRLPEPTSLRHDPFHAEVVALFPEGDPRRLRHRALAGQDSAELVDWARSALDGLDHAAVRALLACVAPEALGPDLQVALAEACLGELDLGGARRAMDGLPEDARRPLETWCEAIDPPRGQRPALPDARFARRWPRASLEAALRVLRTAGAEEQEVSQASRVARQALKALSGPLRQWYEIAIASIEAPHLLTDRDWRARTAQTQPALWRRLMHCRALRLADDGRYQAAYRLLRRVLPSEPAPGRQALMQLDLGSLALAQGHEEEAESHLLRAFRLLKVAGFRNRTRPVLFNLAVTALDQLRLAHAVRWLDQASEGPEDVFVQSERARLVLARGDEREFQALVAALPIEACRWDPRIDEAFCFLRGVSALLEGRCQPAAEFLGRGGEEGARWLDLVQALAGEGGEAATDDGWGVCRAARWLRTATREGADVARSCLAGAGRLRPSDALSIALVDRLAGPRPWLDPERRQTAARLLHAHGLTGWARRLAGTSTVSDEGLSALAAMVEAGAVTALGRDEAGALLDLLGVSGLEVRLAGEDRMLWRAGEGSPGSAVQRGRLCLVPLGGEPATEAGWRLFGDLVHMLGPSPAAESDPDVAETGFHGISAAAVRLRSELKQAARSSLPVVLLGETGAGKGVAAAALHRLSGRRGRMESVNMPGLPGSLIENELFGCERGAFTGAERPRRGTVRTAEGGTLFLDEIGDLDLPLQVKLLRFLESYEVRPVGSDQVFHVDVRIVAATHRDLERLVDEGRFRKDLYYRLASMRIHVPPLRERREDIPILRQLFERQIIDKDQLEPVRWTREAEQALAAYDWPGNVRELYHLVSSTVVRRSGGTVRAEDLDIRSSVQHAQGTWEQAMTEFKRQFLAEALARNGGNRSATARQLEISRQALLYYIKLLGLKG